MDGILVSRCTIYCRHYDRRFTSGRRSPSAVYVGSEVSLRGLLCRWLTTISSGHCASERVWMTSRERGRKTRGHQHEFCAKMKFPAQKNKNTSVNGTTSLAVIVGPKCLIAHLLAPHDRAFSRVRGRFWCSGCRV